MNDLSKYKVLTEHINYNRIHLISDLHMGVRANSLEWLQNIQNFFKNFYIPYLKKNLKPQDVLFVLGDWFDNRQLLDINVLNVAIDTIIELADILPVYQIVGNHDIYKKFDTDVNSIVAFRFIPNVTVYEKPIVVTNNISSILVLPWIGNKENEENYIRTNKYDYIFAHTEIYGFNYDNGQEIKIQNGTDFTNFRNIKRVLSGHIHKRRERDNIIYIGSPYHTKRSDIGNTKGLYIFNPDKNELEFTQNNFSPIFQKILLESILELKLEDTIKILGNNYTDIIVPDKYIHLFNLTKFIDILKECNYKKIETVGERKKLEDELSNIFDNADIRDILSLLEISIDDLGYQMEMLIKLKLLNKKYYQLAAKEF